MLCCVVLCLRMVQWFIGRNKSQLEDDEDFTRALTDLAQAFVARHGGDLHGSADVPMASFLRVLGQYTSHQVGAVTMHAAGPM